MMHCPSSEQLQRLLANQLSGSEAEAVEAHLETCARCQQVMEQLTGNAAWHKAPEAGAQDKGETPRSGSSAAESVAVDCNADFLHRLEQAAPVGVRSSSSNRQQAKTSDKPGALLRHPMPGEPTVADSGSAAPARRAGQFKVTLVPGAGAQPTQELQALLRKRLQLVTLITLIGWGLTWTHKFFRLQLTPDTIWFIMVPGGVFLTFWTWLTATFWARRHWSLQRLRGYELLGYAAATVFLLWENYFTIYRSGPVGDWMQRYAHRDLSEMTTLARHPSIVWFMVIVGYGIFVPNTWRRCAAATGVVACMVLGMNLVCGLWDETIPRRYLFSYVTEMATWLVMAVGYSIYGSHKISVLRQEAFEARQLGQYQLKQRLGAGGMGEVYLAEHGLLRRPCAIKLIRPERAGDPDHLRRFEREVQATAMLTHPNIVEIYDYGHADDGTFYYVMEYLPGLTLYQLVKWHGPLPAARAVHFLRQVCGALREAHAVGLIHRDIKPGNVMVCERGGLHDVTKLLDFGLVRAQGAGQDGERLTQEGAPAGTPAYMSPEQASGREDLDARSDIYSVGCLAYFLVTGQSPFAGRSAGRMLAAHVNEPPAPLTSRRPDVTEELQAIVLRCLAKDPAERFASVESLESALAGCPTVDRWTEEEAASWWRADRVRTMGACADD